MGAHAFDQLNEEMFKRILAVNPDVGTALGLHDPYDMYLPHGGVKRIDDTLDILKEWRIKARALDSTDFTLDRRLMLKVLDISIDFATFGRHEYPLWRMYPDVIEGLGGLVFMMFSRDYASIEFRARAMASRLHQVPRHFEEFRARFNGQRTVKLWTEGAIESCDQFPDFLTFVEQSWKDHITPETAKALSEGVNVTKTAITVQKAWLEGLLKTADADFAMGRTKFEKLIEMRGLGMDSDAILALGEKYLKDLKAEREVISEKISPGGGVDGAKKVVESHAPKTFEEGLKATEEEMLKAKRFIIANGIATIDETSVLKIIETPAFLAPVLPYAALFMPSKFDKIQEGAYVVTRPKDPKDLGSHLNHGSIINTAVHEAYPGHFHQGVRSNGKHWMLQLHQMSDNLYVAAETVEGWAHYCEKMMYDHGYGTDDEAVLEMVNGALWRAYRIVADIRLAVGEATVDEMVDLAVNEIGIPRNAARDEVIRYTRSPGQALSYLIGRHLIIEFRKEMEKELGGAFDEKMFHDLVADYAYLPIFLMRDAVKESMKG
ncbi:MAG: DUF885 domain-containing protein [Candidatus Thermoplasmatota archaeon]|nr:DUF885 domain-containing protein [Candidatus Thermoplasmatota archaeon]